MTQPVISLRDVHVQFEKLVVHDKVSFDIQAAEVVTILGPSGTGKTVLLKVIAGLIRPQGGKVRVLDTEYSDLKQAELRKVRRHIGMLFQGAALFDSLSVFDNVAYSLYEFGEKSEEEIEQIVHEKLELVGLPGIEQKFPPELSGGQKKRVGLARALANEPAIMLFDEPTTGLDPTTIRLIDELIMRLRDEFGITSVVVTHDIESARRVSDRWILLNKANVVAEGPVEELIKENKLVIDFIEGNWKAEILPQASAGA